MTVVVSGPPATGKTTLALGLGRALGAPVFSRDPLMEVLYRHGPRRLMRSDRVPTAGLELQTVLLARQLELGQPAIVECVAPIAARLQWRKMAGETGHRFTAVECVCTDRAVHRSRFEQRLDDPARSASRWRRAAATIERYQPDPDADFIADARRPVTDLVADIVSLIRSEG